jgi:hypothetical protein
MVDSSRFDKNISAPVDRHTDLKQVIGKKCNLADGKLIVFSYARNNLWKQNIAGLRRLGGSMQRSWLIKRETERYVDEL